MRFRFYLFWAGHFELLLSPPSTKTLVTFFPAAFLDPLKPPEERRGNCGSGGVGFLQEKAAGKIVTREKLSIYILNFIKSQVLPVTNDLLLLDNIPKSHYKLKNFFACCS